MSRRQSKKREPRAGDLIGIPLKDQSLAVAQVVGLAERLDHMLCMPYRYRASDAYIDIHSRPFAKEDVIAVQFAGMQLLRRGYWQYLGHSEPVRHALGLDLEDLMSRKCEGMKMVSGPAIESFLNAFHGLGPWVIGTDVDFLTKYAVPGVLDKLPPARRPQ